LLHIFEQMLKLSSWNPPLWLVVHCDLCEQFRQAGPVALQPLSRPSAVNKSCLPKRAI